MDLPVRMQALATYQGLPIPFFTLIRDGRPDFRVHDAKRHHAAMTRRLCGVCGAALDYWIFFLLGPNGVKERLSYMPAMHEECARASMVLCPFLAVEERTHRSTPLKDGDVALAKPPPKPPRSALVQTRGYAITYPDRPLRGAEYAAFAPPIAVTWHRYVDGKLVPEEET